MARAAVAACDSAQRDRVVVTLRQRHIAVVLIHHSGKSGDQLGTSRKTFAIDTMIKLSLPADYAADQGARFIVEYPKKRGFYGVAAEPFEAALIEEGSTVRWEHHPVRNLDLEGLQRAIDELRASGEDPSIRKLAAPRA